MNNQEVASILQDISRILELEGEDTYKIRAYRKASQSIFAQDRDINEYYRQGRLQEIPGVGRSIEELISELLRTGHSRFYEALKKEIPLELYEVMNVPGVGRKTALKVHRVLGVTTIQEFRQAARMHRIRKIRGLGDKVEQKILDSIDRYQKMQAETRIPLFRALVVTSEILSYFKECEGLATVEVVGSVRRRVPLISDINIIATADDPKAAIDCFCNSPVTRIIKDRSDNSAHVTTRYRVDATLEVVDPDNIGLHMVFDTGSPSHIDKLKEYAAGRGVNLDHTGYVDAVTMQKRKFAAETEVYDTLGLEYIPPELREGNGEIEAASNGAIPDLVEASDIKGDLHMHSDWSDGANSIQDMAMAAKAKGYEYIAICDHSRSLGIANGLSIEKLRDQMVEIDRINDTLEDFTILKGSEVDIKVDGNMDLPDDVLAELDIVVGSIHVSLRQEPEVVTQRVLNALENEYLTILAHPTSRIIGRRDPIMVNIDRVIEAAVIHGKVLEVNSYPDRLDLSDENVRKAIGAGAMISIDTDAHSIAELDFMDFGISNARRGWAPKGSVLNTMSYEKLLEFLEGSL